MNKNKISEVDANNVSLSHGRILEEIHWLYQSLSGSNNQEAAEFALDCLHGNFYEVMLTTMRESLESRI